jgi:glycosyltransferase involved in cell wall biosynthesis
MKFTLIVCTYMRPEPLLLLLQSVQKQTVYPNQILIIDGSTNKETEIQLSKNKFKNLNYFLVNENDRGLTKQRNFGLNLVDNSSEVVCFLDDDIVLEHNYFEEILKTYTIYPDASGVGGYIVNESRWTFVGQNYKAKLKEYYYDGWKINDGSRFLIRKLLGLDSNQPPGYAPNYSHGRSVGFLPPTDKIYPVEQLMGGVSSFKKEVFDSFRFSTYFEGYGLYEDADFTLRVSKSGQLYLNTAAKLSHYHDEAGRPNQYKYGKMVVRNGWYVWRVKNPNPKLIDRFKWNSITLLLILIRYSNVLTTTKPKQALTEAVGRTIGLLSLLIIKPTFK